MFPEIVILGFSEAGMFLRERVAEVGAVLSIHGAQEHGVEFSGPRLDLIFDDVESPENEDPVAAYRARMRLQAEAANGRILHPPTKADVEAIVRFAGEKASMQGLLLCHCGAGICRSSAAALICLATWTGPGREEECMQLVKQARKWASPHDGLVRFGDEILGRNGALARAVTKYSAEIEYMDSK